MNIPDNLLYTESHEWMLVNKELNIIKIGVTDYAQHALSDVVFVELPTVMSSYQKGDPFIALESTKMAAEVYCPVNGTVLKINEDLSDNAGLVNESPYDNGWLVEITPDNIDDVNQYLSPEQYKSHVSE